MTHVFESSFRYEHSTCALCGLKSLEGNFMFCSKCRIVVYCSKEHQVSHWKRHKRFCKGHIWKKENPLGKAAAVSCSVELCACKKWHLCESGDGEGIRYADGQIQNEVPTFFQNYNQSTTLTKNGYAPNNSYASSGNSYTLNRDCEQNAPEVRMSYSGSSVDSELVGKSVDDLTKKGFRRSGLLRNQLIVVEGSNNYSSSSSSSSLALEPSSSPNLHSLQEDLENHAPSLFQHNNGTSTITQSQLNQQQLGSNQSSTLVVGENNIKPTTENVYSSGSAVLLSSTVKPAEHENYSIGTDKNPHNQQGVAPPSMTSSSATIPFQHRSNMSPLSAQTSQQARLWMLQVWQKQVIEDMNRYGVCVVDNLLGDARGAAVLREVQMMYSSGAFQDGQLVKENKDSQSKSIRGDKITWVDGREPNCKNIAVLIKLLDNIVMGANTVANNGKLGGYRIMERSKAMVACYPGSGTHYVKHVDNPNNDGRCVTAIYYLNKDWNTSENGGLLRIFPEGWSHQVADIEPLFDRVIFFWSDRRNPHEVQPAFKTRYAITLWYFDSDAKERAKLSAESNKMPNLKAVS